MAKERISELASLRLSQKKSSKLKTKRKTKEKEKKEKKKQNRISKRGGTTTKCVTCLVEILEERREQNK